MASAAHDDALGFLQCGGNAVLFFGSFHEEARLRVRYSSAYRKYERSGPGFYLPHFSSDKAEDDN